MDAEVNYRVDVTSGTLLDGGWLLLPLVAALGGAWAFARPAVIETPATLAAGMALIVGGWLPFWHTLTHTHWAAPLHRWRGWTTAAALPSWPYVQPGTPGEALHGRIGQARAWWRDVGATALAMPLRRAVLAASVSLLLGIVLGRAALLLTLCFLACCELTVLWSEGTGRPGPFWTGIALAGIPWVLGASLAADSAGVAALSGAVLALVAGFYATPSPLAIIGPVLGGAFLAWQAHPLAAGWLLLLALPGLMVLGQKPEPAAYRRATGPWLLGMVLVIASVL